MVERSHEFGIRDNIRFGTRVTACDWDEATARWRVTVETADGTDTVEGWALISAIGPISRPHEPSIPGWDSFDGPIFHANRWPEGVEIDGKRVAIVGTGASSMQIVPAIVDWVDHLTVFQRTAQWVRFIPRFQEEMTQGARWLLQNVPFYVEWFRFTMLWRYGDGLLRTLRRDPDWPHPERAMNRMNDRHRVQMTEFIEAELEGRPDLLEKCLPDYPPYAKRILLDNGWYQALRKPNCDLVTDGIGHIEPDGIVTKDGTLHQADVVLLAIGFQVFLNAAALNVTGRDGRVLADEWADEDPKAHLGNHRARVPEHVLHPGAEHRAGPWRQCDLHLGMPGPLHGRRHRRHGGPGHRHHRREAGGRGRLHGPASTKPTASWSGRTPA